MVEPFKKRKGSTSTTTVVGQHRHDTSGGPPAPPNPSFSSLWSLTLFSFDEQYQRYYSLFSHRIILDPKYLDIEFFERETFDFYQVFQNSELINFMSPNFHSVLNYFMSFIIIYKLGMVLFYLRCIKFQLWLINLCFIH